jgi:hypothetical protein
MAQSNAFKFANNILTNGGYDSTDLVDKGIALNISGGINVENPSGGNAYLDSNNLYITSRTFNDPLSIGTSVNINNSGIKFLNAVPGTITDGAISIERLRYNTTDAATPLTNFSIEGVGTLSGDVDYFEVLVTALNIDASATPTVFNTKSWKFRGYVYRIEDVVTYTEIGTTEILGSLGTTTGLSASLSTAPLNNSLIITLDQASLPGSFTWAFQSKTFTVHKGYTPFGGGGGGK